MKQVGRKSDKRALFYIVTTSCNIKIESLSKLLKVVLSAKYPVVTLCPPCHWCNSLWNGFATFLSSGENDNKH